MIPMVMKHGIVMGSQWFETGLEGLVPLESFPLEMADFSTLWWLAKLATAEQFPHACMARRLTCCGSDGHLCLSHVGREIISSKQPEAVSPYFDDDVQDLSSEDLERESVMVTLLTANQPSQPGKHLLHAHSCDALSRSLDTRVVHVRESLNHLMDFLPEPEAEDPEYLEPQDTRWIERAAWKANAAIPRVLKAGYCIGAETHEVLLGDAYGVNGFNARTLFDTAVKIGQKVGIGDLNALVLTGRNDTLVMVPVPGGWLVTLWYAIEPLGRIIESTQQIASGLEVSITERDRMPQWIA